MCISKVAKDIIRNIHPRYKVQSSFMDVPKALVRKIILKVNQLRKVAILHSINLFLRDITVSAIARKTIVKNI